MTTHRALIIWTTVFLLAAGGCGWLLSAWAPGLTPGRIFLDADIIAKLCMMLMVPVGLLGLIGGLIRVRALAWIGAILTGLLGLLGAAWVEMNIQAAVQAVGPVRFAVTAPSHAEALFTLAFGLMFGVLSFLALRLRRA